LRIAFRILGYLKPYRFKLVLMYVSMAIALVLQLIIPTEIGRAIDHGIEDGDIDYVLRSAIIIVALAAFQASSPSAALISVRLWRNESVTTSETSSTSISSECPSPFMTARKPDN
jgi:ATP-binding cassette subfamily B protein